MNKVHNWKESFNFINKYEAKFNYWNRNGIGQIYNETLK